MDKDGPYINASDLPNPPTMPYAEHDLYDGDIVAPADGADLWFLRKGATGKVVGFGTKGHTASVEWDSEFIIGSTDHNFMAVELLVKVGG